MKDIISIYTVDDNARVYVANTRNLVNQAFNIHQTTAVATAAFGRTLTAGAIMGAMLKNNTDLLTLSIKGDGPIGGVVATVNNKAQVKGYVHNPIVNIPNKPNGKLDVSGAIGRGTLTITKDLSLKEPQSGSTPLVSGEIAEDITYYYALSEQIPSSVALGVLVDRDLSIKQAGGYIIQLMPFASEAFIAHLEATIPNIPSVTNMLEAGQDILHTLFPRHNIKHHGDITPQYHCNCSLEKTTKALIAVGKQELMAILEEDGKANLHCHFCKTDYGFDAGDLREMIDGL